jgi:uncharacterized repeat protein (TIGR03803 family)
MPYRKALNSRAVNSGLMNLCLAACTIFAVAALATHATAQQTEVLYNFRTGQTSYGPYAGVVFDSAGNLYGTAAGGGATGDGIVFKLSPTARGSWTETVLHTFDSTNGAVPLAGVVLDSAGNVYGTTPEGGACKNFDPCGVVFELLPTSEGPWKSRILHNFGVTSTDGTAPNGLIFDSAGNLYGTTANGGTGSGCGEKGCGTVFELIPQSGGAWKEKILYNFHGADGANPVASLVFDSTGNLYGTTYNGGANGSGCVFELSPQGGSWNETVLFSFNGNDNGLWPEGNLVFDASGNLYGTTAYGGLHGKGEVFERSPPQTGGVWTETVLYSFDASKYGNGDGEQPSAGVTFDSAGNLYGTTVYGGNHSGGTMFELSLAAGGGWTETVLHSFQNYSLDSGVQPRGNIVFDASGNLYSTLSNGGHYSRGSVFEILH